MDRLTKIIHYFVPLLIAQIVVFFLIKFGFDYRVSNFDKVLDGAITFSSIVVGFLGALLGILVSIKNSDIVSTIFESKERFTLKYYFNEAFTIGFLVVFLSCTMHVLRAKSSVTTDIIFYVWSIVTVAFVPSTYRIVSILMTVFFKSNIVISRPEDNNVISRVERNSIKERLSKNKHS
ncbi:hypothetical protein GTID1_17100 [Geobacillus thermodenitrificans]|uniref:Uncharacterized protein n=1 Tax=Geobacillus thermodenitrificans TaxID=33940 RepID=A0ABY9QAH6_GEOTD|nr:hypothetical protein [Geobacillus thermodenitrificans]ATO38745.1 hypothetical protein GTID1_17100 [Geobacillus thermodenitrificans]WMV74997.1 hypothetical protein HSX42_11930 [Geobacillus thermodenitrificans]